MALHVFELDGEKFHDLAGFARHFSAVALDGYEWRGNLDAFNDILRGGFGTPEEGFVLRVKNSRAARSALGYAETVRWFEVHATTCHPTNTDWMLARMDEARLGIGATLFDTLVEIIKRHGPGGEECEDNVLLELVED